MNNGYTRRNADNLEKAIAGLDQFTKNWCMNCEETEKTDDLVFRCKECCFETTDGHCLVKVFARSHKCGFNLKCFGCMSR